jgi:hypothetical protein
MLLVKCKMTQYQQHVHNDIFDIDINTCLTQCTLHYLKYINITFLIPNRRNCEERKLTRPRIPLIHPTEYSAPYKFVADSSQIVFKTNCGVKSTKKITSGLHTILKVLQYRWQLYNNSLLPPASLVWTKKRQGWRKVTVTKIIVAC